MSQAPELRSLVEQFDWSSTAVGPPAGWSQSLRTALGICLSSRFPMIIFWGRELVQFYNDAYVPILGARHPRALGQRAEDCWPDIWSSVGPMLRGVLETGEATWSENLLLPIERNGKPAECYFTFSYSPISDEGGIAGIFCAVTETTEIVLRERHVRERAEALAELDTAKTQFFNNVSHEFRTPLTLMLGPLETLAVAVDREQLPLVDIARRNALRLLKLVNTLLDFSRIESGRHEATFASTDLGPMTRELASLFQSSLENAGLELIVDTDLRQPVFVDRAMWEKIVLNLLSNALKFTLQGSIRLELSARGGAAELSVSDTGVGIAAEELPRIFERFQQVRQTRSRSYEGSGIGLALVQELVQIHHGTIDVESEIGRGTTFRVRLPFGAEHLDATQIAQDADNGHVRSIDQFVAELDATIGSPRLESSAPRGALSLAQRARILLADDNRDLREYIAQTLSPAHSVVTVENGKAALAAARAGSFDLILSDVMMPEMDGFELLAAIRSDERLASLPFIFVSARAGEDSAIDGLRHGADDYLVKPFTNDQLIARVDAVLRAARRHEDHYRELSSRRWFERQGDSATNDVAFRAFANQLPIPIWQQDVFGAISFTNTAWHHLLRLPRDPVSHTAEAWQRIVHPEDFGGMINLMTTAIPSRAPYKVTYRLRASDGDSRSYRWYEANAVPQFDERGDFKGWIGSIIDVHDAYLREEAERTLRHEANKALSEFRALAEGVSHIVYTHRADGSFEWANQRWYELTELPEDIALNIEGWRQVVPAGDLEAALATIERALASGESYEIECRYKSVNAPDSAYRWYLFRAVPLRDESGTILRWAGAGMDIHDQRMAAAERERDLRALSEGLPTIVWTAGANGAGEYFNERFREYTGLSPEQAFGGGWLKVLHPDDVPIAVEHWQRSLATGEPYNVTYRVRRRDGAYRWFDARGVCVRDCAGNIERWIGTCTDVDDDQRRYDRERRASDAFQDAALPKSLPEIPGLRFSALYQAGNSEANVGGDWYDAYLLTDGRVVLSIGDVTGSGLSAAVTMSAVRQSIRGASQIYPDPCAVLDAADRALRSEHPEAIVSAFIGIFDPVTETLTYASAGHPPPLLRDHKGAIAELAGSDLMLGLRLDHREHVSHAVTIEPDSMLVLYTDGLTEASRDILQGERDLRRMMTDPNVLASDDPAHAIAGPSLNRMHDDVALLVVRFEETPQRQRWHFDVNDKAAADEMRQGVVAALRRHGVPAADVSVAELLVSELIGNVVRHVGGVVEVAIDVLGSAAVLHVLDRGPGFHFSTRLPKNLMSESGRGLYIVAALARDFSIVPRRDGGSHARVTLPFAVASLPAEEPATRARR
jgi:PAS domain S-box-containing protein